MTKFLSVFVLLCLLASSVVLVSCSGVEDENTTQVSTETTTTVLELYSASSSSESNEKEYELQESFRDDNFWYFIYYLGRVRGIPVDDIATNAYHYTGKTKVTKELKITEMTTERVAKSLESANSVTDGWSSELANSLKQSLSGTLTVQKKVGASAQVDGLKASAEQSLKASITRSLEKGFEEKYGINSTKQNTLAQYEETVKEKTIVTEKTMTFSFAPGEAQPGFYNYITLGTADVFGVVIYDPVADEASMTSVSDWVLLYDELVYFEDESFVDQISVKKLEIDADALSFSKPSTYYETVTDDMLEVVPTTYNVIYNANGGVGTMGSDTFQSNVSKSLSANAFRRDGYMFLGWSTRPSNKDPIYDDMEKVNVRNIADDENEVNLYAVWLKVSCELEHGEHINVTEKSPVTLDLEPLRFGDLDLARIAKYCTTGKVTCTFQTTNGNGNDQNVNRSVKLYGLSATGEEKEIFSKKYEAEYGTKDKSEVGSAPASYFEGGLRFKLSNDRKSWFGDNVNVQSGVKNIKITIVFE